MTTLDSYKDPTARVEHGAAGPLVITDEVNELMKSVMLNGGGSRTFPLPAVQQSGGVIRIDLPPHMARSWRVTLGEPVFANVTTPPMAGIWPLELVRVPAVNWTRATTFAKVQWGVGSSRYTAYVDWRHGGTFVLHASTITIEVVVGSMTALVAAANQTVTFNAGVVPCDGAQADIPGGEGPSITQDSRQIAGAGATAEFAVPPFARRLRLHEYQIGTLDGLQVRFFPTTAAADLLALYTYSASAARSTAAWDPLVPIPVPMNATVVQLQNTAANAKSMLLEWLLNLG